jgi:hypothetical protein
MFDLNGVDVIPTINFNAATANTFTALQTFSSGVKFGGGTGTLNYYEESTWTPGIRSSNNLATFSVNATETVGRYIRVGKMVFVEFALQLSGATSGTTTGECVLQNLPFAGQALASGINYRAVLMAEGFSIATNNAGVLVRIIASTDAFLSIQLLNGGAGSFLASTFSGNGARLSGAFQYQVA